MDTFIVTNSFVPKNSSPAFNPQSSSWKHGTLYHDFYAIYINNLHLYSLSSPNVQETLAAQVHGRQMMKMVLKTRYVIILRFLWSILIIYFKQPLFSRRASNSRGSSPWTPNDESGFENMVCYYIAISVIYTNNLL